MQQNFHIYVSLPTSSLFEIKFYFPVETTTYFPEFKIKKTQIPVQSQIFDQKLSG